MGGTQTGSGRNFLRKLSRVISSLTYLQKLNRSTMDRRKKGAEGKRKRDEGGEGETPKFSSSSKSAEDGVCEVHFLHLEVDYCAEMRKGSQSN